MIGTKETRAEGFYWLVLSQNPPEVGDRRVVAATRGPWQTEAVTVAGGRPVFKQHLAAVA
jgi:hypothetical protein